MRIKVLPCLIGAQNKDQLELAFVDCPEDLKAYKYSVLVTNLDDEVV
jgi:hypothetical protein